MLEIVTFMLDGQDDWDFVGGPGADLDGVRQAEIGRLGFDVQAAAKQPGQLLPIKFPDLDVFARQFNVLAIPRAVRAGRVDVIRRVDSDVEAATAFLAGIGMSDGGFSFHNGLLGNFRFYADAPAPYGRDGAGVHFEG